MKKHLLILTIILSAFSCSDEPEVKLPKNAKMVSKEDFNKAVKNQDPPTCFTDHGVKVCCVPSGGGVICNLD